MSDLRKQYVLSLSNLSNIPVEIVGQSALDLEKIQLLGVNIPNGFVVTTTAFDDFLIANDLLSYISPRINDIDYDNLGSVKKASEEIMHAIRTAIIPPLISEPILQAYSGLSGFYDAFVVVKKSSINDYLQQQSLHVDMTVYNIAGREVLLEQIKEMWSKLFVAEALRYRGVDGYEGYLTEGLVVQKMVQSEVSGKMYTVEQVNFDQNLVEVQAFFGLDDVSLWTHMSPDSYFFDKKGENIIEKKIVGQDWMLVRKGKSGDKTPIIKIPISKLWQKKQKLDDKYILALGRYAKILEQGYGKEIQAEWDYEGGKVYVTNFSLPSEVEVQPSVETNAIQDDQSTREENLSESSESIDSPQHTAGKSIEDYVAEVQKIREDLSTTNPFATDGKVVVEIQAFEELQMLAQGRAYGKTSVFGLVHFIFSETDYRDLTGDEILIVKDFDAQYLEIINSSKGLIIEAEVNEDELVPVEVPVIHGVSEAFDLFQESEVVTMRPWNGAIYLGAGKDLHESVKKAEAKIAQVVEPLVEEINDEEDQPVNKIERIMQDSEPMFLPTEQKREAKSESPSLKLPSVDLPNTATDFWLAYRPGQNFEQLAGLDGIVVRVADIIEKYDKDLFVSELNAKLIEILNLVNGKTVILISAGRGKSIDEIVEAELSAIMSLRNKDSMRNLWYSFDHISNPDELIRMKRVFTNMGLRRSSTFKMFLTIHSPHSLVALKGLLANDLDGIIVDLDLMIKEHEFSSAMEDLHIQEYICEKIALINQNQALSFVLANETGLPTSVAEHFVKCGLNSLVLNLATIQKIKPVIATAESIKKVDRKKKRGRKRKEIDFGF